MLPKRKSDNALSKSHQRAPKQERQTAARIAGRRVPLSGAGDEKGDVVLDGVVRIDCKATKKKSFAVSKTLIQKIREACADGEFPAFEIEFLSESGRVEDRWALIPGYVFDQVVKEQKREKDAESEKEKEQ